MQDLVEKLDRARVLISRNTGTGTEPNDAQSEADANEVLGLGLDAIGELLANSRRIAVALETIAANTKPVELTVATAELGSTSLFPDHATLADMAFHAGQAFVNGRRAAGENV